MSETVWLIDALISKLENNYRYKCINGDKWICIRNFVSIDIQQKYLIHYQKFIQKYIKDKHFKTQQKSYLIPFSNDLHFQNEIIFKAKEYLQNIFQYNLEFNALDGTTLLYGINGKMASHKDGLSRPHITNEEWTFTINIGCDIEFELNGNQLIAHSGDILIMDSRHVLHGVKRIIPNTSPMDIPLNNSRLGIIFWETA